MNARIVLLPGDGIGPEVVAVAHRVLETVAEFRGHKFEFSSHPIGGNAIDECGYALPAETLKACLASDAVLLGAVGGPQWDNPDAPTRPEDGLLKIRKEMHVFANLRPIKAVDCLIDSSPLKREIIQGTDILFVRELTGGIYFGKSGRTTTPEGGESAFNTMIYSTSEIERVVRIAATAAMQRSKRLTMVDKANVLEVSRLWRRVSERVVKTEFPELKYDVVLVDAMAMHLISRPSTFDVVVTSNLFGDILTDEGSMLPVRWGCSLQRASAMTVPDFMSRFTVPPRISQDSAWRIHSQQF